MAGNLVQVATSTITSGTSSVTYTASFSFMRIGR